MNKKKLVIASVLKPVNDSRNYEKTAISINKLGIYQVYLVGQKVKELPQDSQILFNPIFSFERLNMLRFFSGFIFLRYLFRIRPETVVITTAELLWPAVWYKIFSRSKLVYDVQENYFRNLLYTRSFPYPLNYAMAVSIRMIEWLTRPFVDRYILAEKNYEQEFSFSKHKSIVIENKLRKTSVVPRVERTDGTIQLLYTGTIAGTYGIFEAVQLATLLYEQEPAIRLMIAGYAPNRAEFIELEKNIRDKEFITLVGGNEFVPHEKILRLIASSDLGLIPYQSNKSTENCIPTKLYEYLAHKLPFIVNKNPLWSEITRQYRAGIEMDFSYLDRKKAETILAKIKNEKFYTVIPGEEIYWQEEALLTIFK
jgi:glycosyltransferase involved in cell wall biosynthesis